MIGFRRRQFSVFRRILPNNGDFLFSGGGLWHEHPVLPVWDCRTLMLSVHHSDLHCCERKQIINNMETKINARLYFKSVLNAFKITFKANSWFYPFSQVLMLLIQNTLPFISLYMFNRLLNLLSSDNIRSPRGDRHGGNIYRLSGCSDAYLNLHGHSRKHTYRKNGPEVSGDVHQKADESPAVLFRFSARTRRDRSGAERDGRHICAVQLFHRICNQRVCLCHCGQVS